jgi:hypothetical protein
MVETGGMITADIMFRASGGTMTTTIFISHSSQDAVSSLRLAEDLKRAGLQVGWMNGTLRLVSE